VDADRRIAALRSKLPAKDVHSRRAAVNELRDVIGVQLSFGALIDVEARVSDAVKPAVDQARTQVDEAPVKHMPRGSPNKARRARADIRRWATHRHLADGSIHLASCANFAAISAQQTKILRACTEWFL
jgi:hypothetical protein